MTDSALGVCDDRVPRPSDAPGPWFATAHDDPEQAAYDGLRDETLARAGIWTLRIRNEQLDRETLRSSIERFIADR